MKESKMKNKPWNCLLGAVSMLIGVPIDILEGAIGHDGSEIIHPEYPEPACRKGFHIQEIIDMLIDYYGMYLTPIEARPVQIINEADSKIWELPVSEDRFMSYLISERGILIGKNPSGFYHAVAIIGGVAYDPATHKECNVKDLKFDAKIFWILK